jgi:hypothetical protein
LRWGLANFFLRLTSKHDSPTLGGSSQVAGIIDMSTMLGLYELFLKSVIINKRRKVLLDEAIY